MPYYTIHFYLTSSAALPIYQLNTYFRDENVAKEWTIAKADKKGYEKFEILEDVVLNNCVIDDN
jgi:hypothetical protein